jgi:hypothetical protein
MDRCHVCSGSLHYGMVVFEVSRNEYIHVCDSCHTDKAKMGRLRQARTHELEMLRAFNSNGVPHGEKPMTWEGYCAKLGVG